MAFEVISQFIPCSMYYRNQIFNTDCLLHLTTDTFGNNGNTQTFTGRINGGRNSGRASTGNNNVIILHRCLYPAFLHTISGFQFRQKFTEIATSHMQ